MADPELSVVIPCLNEADTIATCVRKAMRALDEAGIDGEVIVADNGSTDGSTDLARSAGAQVVHVGPKGYGNALMHGIAASQGRFIVMADADDSYDLLEIPKFVDKLRQGAELAQGCRLPRGGGKIMPGAMPFLHRWWGNPMFSQLARSWFGSPVNDVYCGMRGFTRQFYDEMDLRCTGMEFATEMILKSAVNRRKIAEVPITLHRDGRIAGRPHLRTFRDGWRTLRFFLLFSPRWLFLFPGLGSLLLGVVGYVVAYPQMGFQIAGHLVKFDVNTLLVASLMLLIGFQAIMFAVFTKAFAISVGLLPTDPRMDRFLRIINLERALILAAGMMVIGLAMIGVALNKWRLVGFGPLDYPQSLRWVIPGSTLVALGFESILASFFLSVLGLRRK
ncbi:MAG: glycosyltransferase family 2 protein [Burkholderiales bacterium]|nr:glycosyltransferase family 2 protein [Phycisphaerae bacterium]